MLSSLNEFANQSFDELKFFDREARKQIPYNVNEVDAVIGYFLKRNFGEIAAINTALILLRQAKTDNLPVFELIDTLKGLDNTQLSYVVAQILNLNRSKTSAIGYRVMLGENLFEQRNIIV
jgi:hypothetical protein